MMTAQQTATMQNIAEALGAIVDGDHLDMYGTGETIMDNEDVIMLVAERGGYIADIHLMTDTLARVELRINLGTERFSTEIGHVDALVELFSGIVTEITFAGTKLASHHDIEKAMTEMRTEKKPMPQCKIRIGEPIVVEYGVTKEQAAYTEQQRMFNGRK